MRRTKTALCCLFIVLLVSGCSNLNIQRKVTVNIPQHPWEKFAPVSLWYNLCWTGYDGTETMYISQDTREIEISIPTGRTVYICAYPLGEMRPFGCAVTPDNTETYFETDQNRGYLCDLMLNADTSAVSRVNWNRLVAAAQSQTVDFRTLDDTKLVKNILNGSLDSSCVVSRPLINIASFSAPGGTWISESIIDGRIIFTGNQSPELELPYGVNRFYNYEKNMELRITVDSSDNVFTYQRQALLSSLKRNTEL